MKVQNKPDYLVFASDAQTGELESFPNISRGWGVTIEQTESKPPMEWMNDAFNRIDKNMLYLLQQGVPEWDSSVLYPVDAVIKYKGQLYIALLENDSIIPSTNEEKWNKLLKEASTIQKGIVQLSSAIDSDSEITSATSKAVKTMNDLVSPIANHIGISSTETAIKPSDSDYYLTVRNDGVTGTYSENKNKFMWGFGSSGELIAGTIPASNVSGLQSFITSLFPVINSGNNGYVKLPNGMLIQWGMTQYLSSDAENGTVRSFYTTFPHSCYVMISSDAGYGANSVSCCQISQSQFKCWGRNPYNGSYANSSLFYIAIGS